MGTEKGKAEVRIWYKNELNDVYQAKDSHLNLARLNF
jgi:hypothetical protein